MLFPITVEASLAIHCAWLMFSISEGKYVKGHFFYILSHMKVIAGQHVARRSQTEQDFLFYTLLDMWRVEQ